MRLKKMTVSLLAAAMAVTTLAGCGAMPSTGNANGNGASENTGVASKEEEKTDGQITLQVVDWSDGSAAQREEFHKKFEETHPNIKIEYTMLTVDQFKNTIVTMIKSGEGPDLFPIPVGLTLNTAVEEGWFQPINDYVTDDFREKFDPAAFAEGVTDIGDEWYTVTEQMPIIQCLFFYNKSILEQMNRMDVMARSLAAAAGGKVAATQKVLTDNGVAPYDSKEMNEALGLIKGLVDDGSIHPDTINVSAPEARELFAQGQAAFLCQGMWCVSQWDANYPDLKYGVMAVPVPDGVTNTYVQAGELSPWMGIYKQSKHPKEAAEYLMALYDEQYGYQQSNVESGSFVSCIPEINEKYMTNEHMKEYYTIAEETSRVVPTLVKRDEKANDFYVEVKDVQPSLGAIVQGIISQSLTDYSSALKTLADDTTTEWKRASEAVGMDYSSLEFPNWDVTKDYTDADYAALK